MLDREVVREFLDEELKGMEIPDDISKRALVETFCKYVEDDYYEWLKDNFKPFFNDGKPDWQWIRERIKKRTERFFIHTSIFEKLVPAKAGIGEL
ncbi:MAG: hypothetical protein MUO55_04660 [Candidatus Atribacteria bacterium]|nr:hypothetical protein [Candidatus Atribacteria bacterium]